MIIKHIVRILFVLFWLVVIYLFLLTPYVEKFFFSDKKSLCIYTWADRLDPEVLKNFEKKTGIKIYVNNYESNEELLTKLEKMPYVDCDIILPSGYIVSAMAESKLIKKIDFDRCNFLSKIYSQFMIAEEDNRNDYSIPLYWDVIGIGYNNKKVDIKDVSLKMVFDRDYARKKKIGMIDDSRQTIALAAIYLGYPLDKLTNEHLYEIHTMLSKQKEWVGAYSDSQQGYFLASETFNMVVSEREYICQQMLKYPFISLKIPKEGSLITVDRVVVSSSSTKDDLVYEFINYLYSFEVLKQNCEKHCLLPVCKDVFEALDKRYIGIEGLAPESEIFKTLKTFKNILTPKKINDFWVRLKAA